MIYHLSYLLVITFVNYSVCNLGILIKLEQLAVLLLKQKPSHNIMYFAYNMYV